MKFNTVFQFLLKFVQTKEIEKTRQKATQFSKQNLFITCNILERSASKGQIIMHDMLINWNIYIYLVTHHEYH